MASSANLAVAFLLISALAWVAMMGVPLEATESSADGGGYYRGNTDGGGYYRGNSGAKHRTCAGKIGECDVDGELAMDSAVGMEVVRRVLATTSTYISYSALTADAVPCSTASSSYYTCNSSSAANPYTPSCTTITLCARDT